jgi:hypothetical protein
MIELKIPMTRSFRLDLRNAAGSSRNTSDGTTFLSRP